MGVVTGTLLYAQGVGPSLFGSLQTLKIGALLGKSHTQNYIALVSYLSVGSSKFLQPLLAIRECISGIRWWLNYEPKRVAGLRRLSGIPHRISTWSFGRAHSTLRTIQRTPGHLTIAYFGLQRLISSPSQHLKSISTMVMRSLILPSPMTRLPQPTIDLARMSGRTVRLLRMENSHSKRRAPAFWERGLL